MKLKKLNLEYAMHAMFAIVSGLHQTQSTDWEL